MSDAHLFDGPLVDVDKNPMSFQQMAKKYIWVPALLGGVLLGYICFSSSSPSEVEIPLYQPYTECTAASKCRYGAISDNDNDTVQPDGKTWLAVMQYMDVWKEGDEYKIELKEAADFTTKYSYNKRGMELSEMMYYNGRLIAGDDKTGLIFELDVVKQKAYPLWVLPSGNGRSDQGMKIEWMTQKGNELLVGSTGLIHYETDPATGEVLSTDLRYMHVATIKDNFNLPQYSNWEGRYEAIRSKGFNIALPGYVWHEAVLWSQTRREWTFVPRKAHDKKFSDPDFERRGTSTVVTVSEDFSSVKALPILLPEKDKSELKGASSLRFLPGTDDKVALILQAEEWTPEGAGKVQLFASYALVVDVTTGKVLSSSVKFPQAMKFEGIEAIPKPTPTTLTLTAQHHQHQHQHQQQEEQEEEEADPRDDVRGLVPLLEAAGLWGEEDQGALQGVLEQLAQQEAQARF